MKNLLYTLLLISSIAFAQQTPESCLEKAKPYLAKDACNGTGIAWVKGALKLDPDNAEAERLLKKCADGEINEAMATLRQEPGNKFALGVLSRYEPQYPSEELYYRLAKGYSQQNTGAVITKYISKAIESNPNNEEYRWIRFRSFMDGNTSIEDYERAIADLEYLINLDEAELEAREKCLWGTRGGSWDVHRKQCDTR